MVVGRPRSFHQRSSLPPVPRSIDSFFRSEGPTFGVSRVKEYTNVGTDSREMLGPVETGTTSGVLSFEREECDHPEGIRLGMDGETYGRVRRNFGGQVDRGWDRSQ